MEDGPQPIPKIRDVWRDAYALRGDGGLAAVKSKSGNPWISSFRTNAGSIIADPVPANRVRPNPYSGAGSEPYRLEHRPCRRLPTGNLQSSRYRLLPECVLLP